MTTDPITAAAVACSFCAKPAREVAKVIAGPGIYICDECVGLCNEILAGAGQQPSEEPRGTDLPEPPELSYWQEMTDEQLLAQLPKIARVAEQVEASLTVWVRRTRSRGVSWARIGAALEMTRQSAWERFSDRE